MKTVRTKAGFIPYFHNGVNYEYLMMVSSDPKFGGDKPMISKGGVEIDETVKEGALREAEEELGLRRHNLKSFFFFHEKNFKTHQLFVYAGEVKSKDDFAKPHFETEYTVWMTKAEFIENRRRDHRIFIEQLEFLLKRAKQDSFTTHLDF